MSDFKMPAIAVQPGVNLDDTASSTSLYTDTHWMRFIRSLPEDVNGVLFRPFDADPDIAPLDNAPIRSMYSEELNNRDQYVYGSATGLYHALDISVSFTNITPISDATPTAAADSLDTVFLSAGTDPVSTTDGSDSVDIDTGTTLSTVFVGVGDRVTIAGVSGTTGGVPASDINGLQIVRGVSGSTMTIIVDTEATATATGGGGSVTIATRDIILNATSHSLRDGERIKVASAATTGGIAAGSINIEHVLKAVTANEMVFTTGDYATSSVAAGGGASTTYVPQITDGAVDASTGTGYGFGDYGEGEYNGSPVSSTLNIQPRLWFYAPFGNNLLITHGESSEIYEWDYDTSAAPTALTDVDAPTDVDYIFTSESYCVALRGNVVQWSDAGDYTEWTQDSTTFAGQQELYQAGSFISHCPIRSGLNLLFTEREVYAMRYNGRQSLVWDFSYHAKAGLMAPYMRAEANGICYWMDDAGKIYRYNGSVQEVPNQCRTYIRANLNRKQRRKAFAWYNDAYNEVWFHWPNKNATVASRQGEPWEITRLNLADLSISTDKANNATKGFTAAEPERIGSNHVTASFIYPVQMELGNNIVDEEGASLPTKAFFVTPFFSPYSEATIVRSVVPDGVQTGTIEISIFGRRYPQDSTKEDSFLRKEATPTTGKVMFDRALENRYWQYRVDVQRTSDYLDARLRAGKWREEISGGAPAN